MTSNGESRIPTGAGGSGASCENKRRSLLPAPKCGRAKSPLSCQQTPSAAATKPDVIDTIPACQPLTVNSELSGYKPGARVVISGVKRGVLRFFGKTHFAEGQWCGIELDDPDGKHNGEVDGHEYFTCSPEHGIFAPVQKVELRTDDVALRCSSSPSSSNSSSHNSSNDREARTIPTPDKTCKLPQPKSRARSTSPDVTSIDAENTLGSPPVKASKLIRPKSGGSVSPRSAETAGAHAVETGRQSTSQEPSITAGKAEAFKSKLAKPSVHGKAPHVGLHQSPTTSNSEDSNNNQPSAIPQSGIAKPRSLLKRPTAGKSAHQSAKATDLGKTYTVESNSAFDEDFPEIVSPSRVDTHTALTLAYDLEGSGSGSGSDTEFPRLQQNQQRQIAVGLKYGKSLPQQPLPDLISPSTQIARTLASQEFLFDSPDALFASQISTVSSIGILTEDELAANQLLPDEDFLSSSEDLGSDSERRESSVTQDSTLTPTDDLNDTADVTEEDLDVKLMADDAMDTEIDKEISGISTPEVDFSSTASKEGSSPEPEPDAPEPPEDSEFDLTYRAATNQNKNRASPTKEDGTAGEKMASPLKDNGNGFTAKEQASFDSDVDNSELVCSTSTSSSSAAETVVVMREKKAIPPAAAAATSGSSPPGDFPRRMRTSADLDEVDTTSMTSSFELTKTAVSQYADLMKAADEEKRKYAEKRASQSLDNLVETSDEEGDDEEEEEDDDADEEEEDGKDDDDDGSESETTETITVDKKCDSLDTAVCKVDKVVEAVPEATPDVVSQAELDEEADQLIADLQAGHVRNERPVSMISTGSADTGIVADISNGIRHKRERPVSLISTSSVDTGYVPDTDSELGTLTTNSPSEYTSPLGVRSPPFFLTKGGTFSPEATNTSDIIRRDFQAVQQSTPHKRDLAESDSDLFLSDAGTLMADSETEREESDFEEQDMRLVGVVSGLSAAVNTPDAGNDADNSGDESGNEQVTVQDMAECKTPTKELEKDENESVNTAAEDNDAEKWAFTPDPGWKAPDANRSHDPDVLESNVIKVLDFTREEEEEGEDESEKKDSEDTNRGDAGVGSVDIQECVASEPASEPVSNPDLVAEVTGTTDVISPEADNQKMEDDNEEDEDEEHGEVKIKQEVEDKVTLSKSKVDTGKKSLKSTTQKTSPTTKKVDPASEKKKTLIKTDPLKKSNTKNVASRVGSLTKKKIVAKTKEEIENTDSNKNPKVSKNATNRKMSNSSLDKTTTKAAVEKLSKLSSPRDRKLGSNQKTVEVRPVIVHNQNGGGDKKPPPLKRNPPKSKWDNIMSSIDNKKEKPASTTAPKSKLEAAKTNRPSSASKPLTSSGPGTAPRKTSTNSGTNTTKSSVAAARRTSVPARLVPPTSKRPSPDAGSRKSSASDVSALDSSRNSGLSSPRSRPTSATKPANRTTSTLRKHERSSSIGSDSQDSTISELSQVSSNSQGSRSTRSTQQGSSTPRESTPEPPKRTITKRKSLIEPPKSFVKRPDPRRASVATPGTSRLGTAAKSPRVPGSLGTTPAKKTLTPPKDQNRNKTVKSKNHLKHPNQPDLVTNAIGSSRAAEEISRLEALCESRTKELNYIKMQLKQKNSGFEAMAILVKYLTQELNAFSCPTVTAQLQETKDQLIKAKGHLDELTNQRDALIDEIQCLKQQHQDETEKLSGDHKTELSSLEQRLKKEGEDAVNDVVERHSKEVTTLTTYHERSLAEAKLENEKALQEKDKEHEEKMLGVQKEHEQQLAELQKKHESQLEEITMRFEHIKVTLSEKVEYLRNECEEMRRREKTYMEACKRDTDRKVQAALAPYKHIQQEIESLTAVMELRKDEIHQLRRQKLELEKQLEELPAARDQIQKLKQKVENLEAIQEIKTDYEKQLAEKHQSLLRKFDRESKANKRLSMDNEELAWRLNQSDAGSPDLLRRSISHSPTNSDANTPEPPCKPRRRSPLPPHSPRSPNGMSRSADFDRSPCGSQKKSAGGGTNLRRSGTYDLLDQEFNEDDKMSESDV